MSATVQGLGKDTPVLHVGFLPSHLQELQKSCSFQKMSLRIRLLERDPGHTKKTAGGRKQPFS